MFCYRELYFVARQWLVRKTSSASPSIACAAQRMYIGFRASKAHRSTHLRLPLQAIVHPRWDLSDRSFPFGQSNLKHTSFIHHLYQRKEEEKDSLYIKERKTTRLPTKKLTKFVAKSASTLKWWFKFKTPRKKFLGVLNLNPATTYFPTESPLQYHRRGRA